MTGSPEGEVAARRLLGGVSGIEIVPGRFGDIWLRDTGPIFAQGPDGARHAVGFQFNGWGEKFLMDHDDEVAAQIAVAAGVNGVPGVLEAISDPKEALKIANDIFFRRVTHVPFQSCNCHWRWHRRWQSRCTGFTC
jgi:hypothetical protein